MANVAYPGATGMVGLTEVTTSDSFVPELWSDDIIAAYKKSLVMGNLVSKINHVGKKGDTIHIPSPTRGSAFAKAENTAVTIQANTESQVSISLNLHYEYSRLIEDIVSVQALDSLRRFYTDDAGYALAKQVDDDIFAQFESLQGGAAKGTGTWTGAVIGGDGSTAYDQTANTNTGNGSDIADAGIRTAMTTLDNADVPMDGRKFVIPPVARKDMLAITGYTSADFVSGRPTVTGTIGDLFGMDVILSTNCPTETAADTSTTYRICAMFHKDAVVFAEQMAIRSQTQYKQEYLADLMTSDCIYGVGELRNDAGILLVVPST